jgi:transcriptional regulator with XRE-family HTH domain
MSRATTQHPITEKARETGGYVLRVCREAAGLTQREVADRAGVSASQLGRMERGDVRPLARLDQLVRVADAVADLARGRANATRNAYH